MFHSIILEIGNNELCGGLDSNHERLKHIPSTILSVIRVQISTLPEGSNADEATYLDLVIDPDLCEYLHVEIYN